MNFNPKNYDPVAKTDPIKASGEPIFNVLGLPGSGWTTNGEALKAMRVEERRNGADAALGRWPFRNGDYARGSGARSIDHRWTSEPGARYLLAKRAIDIAFAVLALALTGPLLLLCAAMVKLVSRGPAFLTVERFGRGEKPFRMFKLRTMYVDAEDLLKEHFRNNPTLAEEWTRTFKLRDDPRLIPWIGSFLRKSSIDELPQLLNVLRGDMSLVGPRPLPGYHLAAFDPEFRKLRASVAPGLTGLWQVECRNTGGIRELVSWDSKYVKYRSLRADLAILRKTISVVVSGEGAY